MASLSGVQRLYSMFPTGRPGIALLLVRIALGIMLMDGVTPGLVQMGSFWLLVAPAVLAFAACLGVLTPVVAVLCIGLEVSTLIAASGNLEAVHVCAMLDSVAIGLLGPGAYSVDARLFGRRQIVFPPARNSEE